MRGAWRVKCLLVLIGGFGLGCNSEVNSIPFEGSGAAGTTGGATTATTTGSGGGDTGGDTASGADTGGSAGVQDPTVEAFGWRVEAGPVLVIEWPATTGQGTLVIQQETEEIPISPQGANWIEIRPGDPLENLLMGLKEGNGHYRIEDDGIEVENGPLKLTSRFTRFFDFAIPNPIEVVGLPTSATAGQAVAVSGTAGPEGMRKSVFVGTPAGRVDTVALADENLSAGTPFEFAYTFTQTGVYVVELLATNGLPVGAFPVYVLGGPMPLVIPALDRPLENALTPPLNPKQIGDRINSLVNDARSRESLSALATNIELENTAQIKAEQIADAGIPSHSTSDGQIQSVGTIAASQGLSGEFGENFSIEFTAERAFETLWWSPSHRRALLDPAWASQGVGAAMFDVNAGHVVFVQHFSSQLP